MFADRTNWKLAQNRLTLALEEVRAAGASVLDLSISNPTQCGFSYDEAAILAAFQNPRSLEYDPQPKGLLAARQQVARYYEIDHRTVVDPDSIILTTSTSEAYSYLFRLLCNAGDEVLVPKPSYPLFDFLADLHDVSLVPYTLAYAQGWMVDFQSVERAITPRTRAILLVHPNNPTGSHIRAEEARQFREICRARDLALIVDEVFLDYAFDGVARQSFTANADVLTFTLSGLSKISALPQMKVAWVAASGPQALVRSALERLEVIADTFLSLSAPAQWSLPALLEQRHALRQQLLHRLRENRAALQALVTRHKNCELLDAEAGWYAVLRVPVRGSDEDLGVELLRKKQVLVHPGHFYDFPREGYLVLSLLPQPNIFREGVERLLAFQPQADAR